MNTIRQVKLILYRLKRDFGQLVNVLTNRSMTQNILTGEMNISERLIRVKRGILVDAKMSRDFVYDLSFIAANKNFTYGGLFDTSTRDLIIDGIDLPRDYAPSLNDRCIHDHERYQFKKIEKLVYGLGYRITIQHLEAQKEEAVEEMKVANAASTEQETTNA